jgi:hypothetical protein
MANTTAGATNPSKAQRLPNRKPAPPPPPPTQRGALDQPLEGEWWGHRALSSSIGQHAQEHCLKAKYMLSFIVLVPLLSVAPATPEKWN